METSRQANTAAPFGSVGFDIATCQEFRHTAGRSDALRIPQDVVHIALQHPRVKRPSRIHRKARNDVHLRVA